MKDTLTKMLEELNIQYSDLPKTRVLDKKWNTILVMQKKITELE